MWGYGDLIYGVVSVGLWGCWMVTMKPRSICRAQGPDRVHLHVLL